MRARVPYVSTLVRHHSPFGLSVILFASVSHAETETGSAPPSQVTRSPSEQATLESEVAPDQGQLIPLGLGDALLRAQPPCQYHGHVYVGRDYLVACGTEGLWAVRKLGDTFVIHREKYASSVVGVSEANGAAVVDLAAKAPVPPRVRAPGAGRDGATPLALVEFTGEVVSSRGETAKLLFSHPVPGRAKSVRIGARVFQITKIVGNEVTVTLGQNETLAEGEVGTLGTDEPTTSLVGPPENEATWVVSGGLRPWYGDTGGFGVVLNSYLGFRHGLFRAALVLESYNVGSSGVASFNEVYARFGFAARYFAAGIGIGAASLYTIYGEPPGEGLAYSPYLRVGAEDGISLLLRPAFAIFHSEAHFVSMNAFALVPVQRGVWAQAEIGGGNVGVFHIGGGARFMVQGNGGSGTSLVSLTTGYQRVHTEFGGGVDAPYLGFQFERRL